jgi:hypothetical protein
MYPENDIGAHLLGDVDWDVVEQAPIGIKMISRADG